MNPNSWSFSAEGIGEVAVSYSSSTNTFILDRKSSEPLPPNTEFTVVINPKGTKPGFMDLAGNPAPTYAFSFTTRE
jgi:hypothetical protein